MINSIYNASSALASLYLWSYALAPAYQKISSIFKPIPKSDYREENDPLKNRIFNVLGDFLKKHNLDNNLKVYTFNSTANLGSVATLKEKAVLVVSKYFDTDQEAFKFLFKHEIGHLVYGDSIKSVVLQSVASIGIMYFCRTYCGLSLIPSFLSYGVLNQLFKKATLIPIERRADNFAISNASIEEIKGGLRFVEAFQISEQSEKIPYVHYIKAFFNTHPSSESRKLAVKAALNSRGIEYNPTREEVEPIVKVIRENKIKSMAQTVEASLPRMQ